jgi:hypothetical protein
VQSRSNVHDHVCEGKTPHSDQRRNAPRSREYHEIAEGKQSVDVSVNGHVTLDFHVEEDPFVTCASDALGPSVQGSKLETAPAKVASQVFEVFLVGRAIKTSDDIRAAKSIITSQLEKAH